LIINIKAIKAAKLPYIFLEETFQFFVKHKELTLILFIGFILRYFILDWNSYWLDELFSVYEWGIRFATPFELLSHFRDIAYPVPVYEFILFNWMLLFGHSEVATRLLSTIFVTLATLVLYLFTLRIFSRRIAVATILFFSLSHAAVYYSLETRYYGLILFLSIFSSYILMLYLESIGSEFSIKKLYSNKLFFIMTLTNIVLILTHLYTIFFIVSQAIFVIFYFIFYNRLNFAVINVLKAISIYLLQFLLTFALWGSVIADFLKIQFIDNNAGITNYGSFWEDPLLVIFRNVVEPNLSLPLVTYKRLFYLQVWLEDMFILVFISIIIFFVIIAIKYTGHYKINYYKTPFFQRKIFIYYIILWLFIPPVLVSISHSLSGLERFFYRYIIYCVPPLLILTVVTLERGISLLDYIVRRLLKKSFIRHFLRFATLYAIIAAILLIVPGGFTGATTRKADWRDIANHIVEYIHRDPDQMYIIYEITHSEYYTLLDYYLKRYSDRVRVFDTIQESVEYGLKKGVYIDTRFLEDESKREISRHDFLIVSFHDLPTGRFPHTIELLSDMYDLTGQYLDNQGRGFLVFKIGKN